MENSPDLDLDKLKAIKILGRGAMGTVFLVHNISTDPNATFPFALKVVQRTKHDADRRARWEIQVLKTLSPPDPTLQHPFLPRLLGHLETPQFLAWAIPYCPGSDLNVLRFNQNDQVFSPAVIRFYISEILCALQHLHSMNIVYRDLKPENILIQLSGHVTLTDFDLSRNLKKKQVSETLSADEKKNPVRRKHHRWNNALKKAKSARVSPVSRRKPSFSNEERSSSFVGTEEYVSPEVVRGEGHEFAVDWWALGILTYEMLYGTTPFKGKNRKEAYRNVLTKEPKFMGQPNDLTDLIGRLLHKDPKKRLGYQGGACEIKKHLFFKGVRWDLLTEVLRPPFIPSRDDGESNEEVMPGKIDIREYFESLKAPSSMPPSPFRHRHRIIDGNVPFAEY